MSLYMQFLFLPGGLYIPQARTYLVWMSGYLILSFSTAHLIGSAKSSKVVKFNFIRSNLTSWFAILTFGSRVRRGVATLQSLASPRVWSHFPRIPRRRLPSQLLPAAYTPSSAGETRLPHKSETHSCEESGTGLPPTPSHFHITRSGKYFESPSSAPTRSDSIWAHFL